MSKHSHHHGSDHNHLHHDHVPYWKRAHTDWRFWVGVLLMFGAMMVYVLSDDLAWRPSSQQPPPAGELGK
jgi:hypothetical protein